MSYAAALKGFPEGYGEWLKGPIVKERVSHFLPVSLLDKPKTQLSAKEFMEMMFRVSVLCQSTLIYAPVLKFELLTNDTSSAWITINQPQKRVVVNLDSPQVLANKTNSNEWMRLTQQGSQVPLISTVTPAQRQTAKKTWFKLYLQLGSDGRVSAEPRTAYTPSAPGSTELTQDFLKLWPDAIRFYACMVSIPMKLLPKFQGAQCTLRDPFSQEQLDAQSAQTLFIFDDKQRYCYERESLVDYFGESNLPLFPFPTGESFEMLNSQYSIRKELACPNLVGFQTVKGKKRKPNGEEVKTIRLQPIFATWKNVGLN